MATRGRREAGRSRMEDMSYTGRSHPTQYPSQRSNSSVPPVTGTGGDKQPSVPKKRKNGVIRMSNSGWMLYIVVILLVSCALSYFAVTVANDMFGLVKEDMPVAVHLDKEESLEDVANMLYEEGIISHPKVFALFAKLTNRDDFNYGSYDLNKNMTYQQITATLRNVAKDANTVKVTLPEGLTIHQMYAKLEEAGVCDATQLEETGQSRPWKHSFLASDLVPMDRTNRIEGYLFPDTYEFYQGDTAVNVLNKMLLNFDSRFTEEYEARAAELGMSIDQVVILASIIEKEAGNVEEMPLISSVFHNRLNGALGGYLQSDATLKYVIGSNNSSSLNAEEMEMDNPYNTYKYQGLPPGPICCPGDAAINAALYPEATDYLYFVANADGTGSLFATTLEEHNQNRAAAGR